MALTNRARKRLLILVSVLMVLGAVLVCIRLIQTKLRSDRAVIAREIGREAMEQGDWNTALSELGLVVALNKQDYESVLMLAEARSQVPQPNNKHLQTAMTLFVLAEQVARELDGRTDVRIAALEGRGKIEFLLGQITRLRESSFQLLEIDSENDSAIEQLLAVSEVTGNLLPSDPNLLIRGDRPTVDWLEALRDAGDESCLRWVLEQFIKDSNSSARISEILTLLRRGESENRQEARLARVAQSQIELLELFAEEFSDSAVDIEVLKAREWLFRNDFAKTRAALDAVDPKDLSDPQMMLLAAAIWNALGTPEARQEGRRILDLAASDLGDDAQSRIRIATQLWHLDESAKAKALVEGGLGTASMQTPLEVETLILDCQLTLLSQESLGDERRDLLTEAMKQRNLPLLSRRRIELLRAVDDVGRSRSQALLDGEKVGSIELNTGRRVAELCGNFSSWMGDSLMLCILADLATSAGLDVVASNGMRDALAVTGGMSAPISRRLVASYARTGASLRAFQVAADYVRQYQTKIAAAIFAEAWINLEESGLNAVDYEPWVMELGTPVEFLERIRSGSEDEEGFLTRMLARGLVLEGKTEMARAILLEKLSAVNDVTAKLRILAAMSGLACDIPEAILDAVSTEVIDEAGQESIAKIRSKQLERKSGPAAALAWFETMVPSEVQSRLRRYRGLLEFRVAKEAGASTSSAFDTLLSADVSERDLPFFMRLAAEMGDRQSGERVFRLAIEPATEASLSAQRALVAALFVVNFDLENEESLATAIRLIDPIVASGNAGPELEFHYSKILRASGEEKTALAIEILRSSIVKSPERYGSSLLLCEMLQETLQFDDAGEILRDLVRRTGVATEKQQAKLALLLSRQGEIPLMAESICDLAKKTGRIASVLQCVRVKRLLGETDEADRLLDELSVRPDRTVEVEIAVARRLQSQGDTDSSIRYLEESGRFESESRRSIAIAEIANAVGRWDEVISRLTRPEAAAESSAKSQLLLAMAQLQVDPALREEAAESLRLAVDLEPENRGVLRRAALIAIESDLLVDSREFLLGRLFSVDEPQANLLRLAMDFDSAKTDPEADWDLLEIRSARVVEKLPSVPIAWELRIDVVSFALEDARRNGAPDAIERFGRSLDQVGRRYVSRFPGQASSLSRQAKILLILGKSEEAVLVARACLEANVEVPRIGLVIDLARAEFQLKSYNRVLDALDGFASQIAADPERFPLAWNLMFRSLLVTGETQAAANLYSKGPVSGPNGINWAPWIRSIEIADPRAGLDAARIVSAKSGDVRDLVLLGTSLNRLYRSSGDSVVVAYIEQLKEQINALLSKIEQADELELLRFQVGVSEFEAAASSDLEIGVLEGVKLLEAFEEKIFRAPEQFESIPVDGRKVAEEFFATSAVFMNNLVARIATFLREVDVSAAESTKLKAIGQSASDFLFSFFPRNAEILDTLSDFKQSVGDYEESLELIRNAISLKPSVAAFYITYARVLQGQEDLASAVIEAQKAVRLLRAAGNPAPETLFRAEELVEAIEDEIREGK